MSAIANKTLQSQDISFAELCRLEADWSGLLAADDPRALSASPLWTKTWWEVFESSLTDPEWRGIAVKDSLGELVGLALFYLHRASVRGFSIRRLELLGQCWRSGLSPRTEYGGIIASQQHMKQVTEAVHAHIASWKDWDEMIVGNTIQDDVDVGTRRQLARQSGWYCRVHEIGSTYAMTLGGDFESYRAALPGKFRQRVFNHRQKLAGQGRLVSRSAKIEDTDAFLEILNSFHLKRWGKPVFQNRRLKFHQALTRELAARDQLYLNTMQVDDRPVSVLYDIVAGSTKYGFQLGFDNEFNTKVSLFSVHLGYSIEDAFERRLTCFDMLRGHGRSGRDYKDRVAAPYRTTATEQYIRSPGLRGAMRAYDMLTSVGRRAKPK